MFFQQLLNKVTRKKVLPTENGQEPIQYSVLQQVDLAFIVDTTASMGPFIQSARQQMTDMLHAVTHASPIPIDLRVGIVEYRDHPPQEHSFVTRTHRFGKDLSLIQQSINKLRPNGGGDVPEAVYDGIAAAGEQLLWRTHSHRLAVLIGDAPPHQDCACGITADEATALLEEQRVLLYSVGLTNVVQTLLSGKRKEMR
ncbi:VWA domain-containing protein [Chloroflexi bacterium TSY]|nr:VWA domain-containing protein [Chloroflexi bacterium TSY]